MGQKTHPTGFRVGIIQPWASTWFAKVRDYAVFVAEDAKIRKFVKKKLYAAGVSRILIARKAQNTTITVVTAKPGIVVGRGGQGIDELRQEVTKYIGRPYVWGGSNPTEGFDCSGFVCWSFTKSGAYYLPRTTAQNIFNQCVPLPREEAVAGDLIFFTDTYETSNPVSHVGIYIGNGIMLHCGDPIGYASIDTAYWQKHFYAFGRLSDEEETR